MKHRTLFCTLLLALPLSTGVVACGGDEDIDPRAALEREALERDLNLALEPDTAALVEFADVALEEPLELAIEPEAPPAPVAPPAPSPRPERTEPRPEAPRRSDSVPEPVRPRAPRMVSLPVPSGTVFAVRMNDELISRDVAPGASFSATLSEPLSAADGTTLIPAGATVRGRVASVQASGRAGQEASIDIAFDAISHGGRSYPIDATVLDVPVRTVSRDSRMKQAAKIGGGAAVGAALGQIIGKNTKSTLTGAAIGAAAGTAVVIGTADVDAVIPEGATVRVRLDTPVRVERRV